MLYLGDSYAFFEAYPRKSVVFVDFYPRKSVVFVSSYHRKSVSSFRNPQNVWCNLTR